MHIAYTPCTKKKKKKTHQCTNSMHAKNIKKLDEMENLNTKVNFQLPFKITFENLNYRKKPSVKCGYV